MQSVMPAKLLQNQVSPSVTLVHTTPEGGVGEFHVM